MSEPDILQGYLILLYIFLGMFALLLIIFLCKRWKNLNKGNFLREIGRELGLRDSSLRDSSTSETSLWRASSSWNSKSYNYIRHSTSSISSANNGVPSIVVTEKKPWTSTMTPTRNSDPTKQQPTAWEIQKAKRSSSAFLNVPLDVIEEEEVSGSPAPDTLHVHNNNNDVHNINTHPFP